MTEQATTSQPGVLAQILDYANRADPYPLYAQLRKSPVFRAPNGSYVVSTYREIWALMHDPRIGVGAFGGNAGAGAGGGGPGSFIGMDPPAHDRLRRLATSHFEQTEAVRPDMVRTASELIDNMRGKHQIDVVDDFAYPLPVTVICQQLGVPHEDEPRFHPWAEAIITQLDPRPGQESAAAQASAEMNQYMAELVERYRSEPGPGLLSGLAAEEGMSTQDVVATGRLLLIAGHETTVNLITNGMLTLLRHPEILERLRNEEQLAIPLVEELLRYEPPVQINPNTWPWTTSRLGRSRSRRAHASSSRWPPATETRTGFPILTVSTRSGTTTSIWVFSPASTTASAPGSRVRRRRPR